MNIDSLEKLYVHELKDLYSAETQLLEALPKMAAAASHDELKAGFEEHLKQTKQHVARLEAIFKTLDFQPGGHKCNGMEGLIAEGEEILREDMPGEVRDAALVAAAQRVEHYEMAGYGVASTYAEKLGHKDHADLLTETLEEEGATDRKLSRLATRCLNFFALTA
ncbi:ferritin-like domain-containing protein [Aeoliella sp. ICT_H6.2]|uniref:Ferritin-like domain-containing protein n=1 Tax=Aeoliella straminimaris TaxID=2954799 RepID=A0A9X2JF36_9BACT|nr:ferritin-like domain-containing protein [Aeoliella straminimaris]MCO6042867.1 ferritin-like domain-containing protein [Aeoliella straminimaris]